MAVTAKTEFDLDATPEVIMEILLDVPALPEWSGPHKEAEVLTTHDDGSPARARMVVSAVGVSDEQTVDYTWTENTCTWDLVESNQLKEQHGVYTITENGSGGSHVAFELTIDLKIKMPGLLIKQGQKKAVDTARKGLAAEVERRAAS